MKRGEIWLVGLDPSEGHEQKGRRPVLIVSPEAFNQITKVPVVLPITSGGNFVRTAGFAVPLTALGPGPRLWSAAINPARSISAPAAPRNWKAFPPPSWMKFWRN